MWSVYVPFRTYSKIVRTGQWLWGRRQRYKQERERGENEEKKMGIKAL